MAPPAYIDLGKEARDLFSKGYFFNTFKLESKTKTKSNVEFTVSGNSNMDSKAIAGFLETKYKWSEYGLTMKEKWTTDNMLNTEITCEDYLSKGFKVGFETLFSPNTGNFNLKGFLSKYPFSFKFKKKNAIVKTAFKHPNFQLSGDFDVPYIGSAPVAIGTSAVIGYENWLAGCHLIFDATQNKISRANYAFGYRGSDFTLHTNCSDANDIAVSLHQMVRPGLETGVQIGYAMGSQASKFGFASKYQIDAFSSIRAKINNASQVGLTYSHKLKEGVSLSLSALIDAKNLNQGGHQMGLALEIEA